VVLIALLICVAFSVLSAAASGGHITVSGSLPAGNVGSAYSAAISISGGKPPYQCAIVWGALPPGFAVDPVTGTVSVTPTSGGNYNFSISARDRPNNYYGDHRFKLTINGPSNQITVAISPTSATVQSNGTQQFTATVSGTPNTAVTWSTTAGKITANGLLTAPTVTKTTQLSVTATSVADPTQSATASVTVNPISNGSLTITTSSLPQATVSVPYSATLSATGGQPPYTWSISTGSLPAGMQLNSASGTISGTASQSGSYSFTAKVGDTAGANDTQALTLSVVVQNGSGYDGPAQLPLV